MNKQIGQMKSSQHFGARQMRQIAVAVTLVVILVFSMAGRAQGTTSQVNGTVTDSTGAIVIGANITIANTATGLVYRATSDSLGAYHVTELLPGSYTMDVSKSGFATQHLQPFTLIVGQLFQQNITLSVGQTTQTVSVSAAALLLNTEASHDEQLIEGQQIDDMPLNGRDYLQLAQLDAGVVPISGVQGINSPASSWASDSGVVAIDISGLREDDNSFLYDGIETRNAWYGAAGLQPDPDMVQEFVMMNSDAPAQYGSGGAFVNVVTRSGTNRFHGTAYEYLRNNDFDARNYFDDTPGPPAFHQNQFGVSAGGPIKRNKIFFFGNYEGFRQLVPGDDYNLVPDVAVGSPYTPDLSNEKDCKGNPATVLYNPYVLDPSTPCGYAVLPGNTVPVSLLSAIGQKILALYPAPNGSYNNGTANYFNVATTTNNWNQFSGRVDYAISAKDTIFGRYTSTNQTAIAPGMTSYNSQTFPSAPKNVAVGWTHVFSPRLVNNVRYGWSHTAVGLERTDGYDTALANPLGLTAEIDFPGSDGPPSIGVSGYGNPGSTNGTDFLTEGLNMWTESLMFQKGKHQLTGGVDIRYEPIYSYEDWSATSIGFSGVYSGDPVADLLMGVPNSTRTSLGTGPTENLRMWYQAYYVQDNFKVNRKLTLNYGLRYEHRTQPVEVNNRVGSFDVATGQDLTYPDTKVMGLGRSMVMPIYSNVAPRFGFNYMPSEKGNTDIKGGFGMYYLQPNINQYQVEVDTTKLYEVDDFNNPAVGDALAFNLDGTQGVPGMYSSAMTNGNFSGGGPTVSFIQPNGKTPYAYEWNLTIDKTIKDWLFEVAYVGTSERHYEERNEIDPLNTNGVASLWATCGVNGNIGCYSGVQENQESGTSNYHALIGRVQKRFSSGFSATVNYTWSKCLGTPYQDEFTWHVDMHLDYSHCTEDINSIFTANGIYELPFGHGKTFLNSGTLADAIVGGWKLAGISTLRTGPWTTLGSQQNIGFFDGALPDLSGPVNNQSLHGGLGRHGRLGPYINTQNVINLSAVGVQGESGTHTVENPGSQDYDLSGYKGWRFGEKANLTFRADLFNAFNRVNFGSVSTYDLASNFGDVSSAYPAREIQLSLRLAF
ncbi:MAG: carboxypeptidase regulatory-like domain-containing protein [Terracidiphilus sp.]|jgi:hypothetical protein